ncbi:hypothetical protein FB451DRAFT_1032601, partial [Mycena latifolia]
AFAPTNGMDMSMDDGMALASCTMMTTPGSCSPSVRWRARASVYLSSLVDRWIAAVRAMMEGHWRAAARSACKGGEYAWAGKEEVAGATVRARARCHGRGLMHALQAVLGFAFMCILTSTRRTFQASFILGHVLGEVTFGRYVAATGGH